MRTRPQHSPTNSTAVRAAHPKTRDLQGGTVLLTVPEAAARLGIGRTLMYELIRTGAVDSVRVGRLRRIRPADLDAYAAGLPTAPADQLPAAA